MPRLGHVSIVYRTWDYEVCAKWVEIEECSDYNRKGLTCPICVASEENNLARVNQAAEMKESRYWFGPEAERCPQYCCPLGEDDKPRSPCKRNMGSHGQAV